MELVQLLQPERLAWLLLLPLLYLLSRPPRPKRARLTAHLRQWQRAQAKIGRKPSRQRRLRFLLLVLAFLAAVLAHARPRLGGRQGAKELVILVDGSASLAARAPGEADAWSALRRELERGLERVPAQVPLRLGLCGSKLELLRGTRQELLAALPQRPGGAAGVDLAALAESLQAPGTALWTLTDGLGSGRLPQTGALSLVGAARENVALTAVELVDRWPLPDLFLGVRLQNFGSRPMPLRLEIEGAVEPTADQPLELGPGEARSLELGLRRQAGGLLRLRLRPMDGDGDLDPLALDDEVGVLLPGPPAPDIAVLEEETEAGGGRRPGLQAGAKVLAAETGGRVLPAEEMQRAGFLLVEGGVLPAEASGMRLCSFGTRFGAGAALQPRDLVLEPKLLDWERGHPLTLGLDFSELALGQCLRQDFGKGQTPLLWAEHGPLALVSEDASGRRAVHLAFRLSDSNLAQLPAFPQFLRRCFAWTHGEKARARLAPGNLLSAAESDLRQLAEGRLARGLPAFGEEAAGLAVPLLLLGLLALAARVYV